jgi:hypothetical protein
MKALALSIRLGVAAVVLSGCTTTSQAPVQLPAGATAPALSVKTACGDCQVSAEVIAELQRGYVESVQRAGGSIDATSQMNLLITRFSDRGPSRYFMHMIIGPLAIALHVDRIEATIEVNGVASSIEDTARIPFRGINDVASKVGANAAQQWLRSAVVKHTK